MTVKAIVYSTAFVKDLKRLPRHIIEIAIVKERLFKENPMHPSIRLHPLKGKLRGLWSISVSAGHRIIFERQENGDILFIAIGKHDIYKYA